MSGVYAKDACCTCILCVLKMWQIATRQQLLHCFCYCVLLVITCKMSMINFCFYTTCFVCHNTSAELHWQSDVVRVRTCKIMTMIVIINWMFYFYWNLFCILIVQKDDAIIFAQLHCIGCFILEYGKFSTCEIKTPSA